MPPFTDFVSRAERRAVVAYGCP